MRRFELHRVVDESGVSGLGVVAEGVEFGDHTIALRWLSSTASTILHESMENLKIVHGHQGKTVVVWIDP